MKTFTVLLLICCIFTGCTVNVVDKRLTREEVAAALRDRDNAINALAVAVKALQDTKDLQSKGDKK